MGAFVFMLYKNHISSSEENEDAQLKKQKINENGILRKKINYSRKMYEKGSRAIKKINSWDK